MHWPLTLMEKGISSVLQLPIVLHHELHLFFKPTVHCFVREIDNHDCVKLLCKMDMHSLYQITV